jgi:hypothetical protein
VVCARDTSLKIGEEEFMRSLVWLCLLVALPLSTPLLAKNAANFRVELSGENEVPPVITETSGTALFHVNQQLTEITVMLDISNADNALGAAGAHLHCAPAGANGPVVAFLAGAFSPGYDGSVQLRATLNDGNVTNAACGATIAELVGSMLDGQVYVNVHSSAWPGGVVRGQVQ